MAQHGDTSAPQGPDREDYEKAVGYVHTTNLPALFHELGISLFVTTYQAQRLLVFSAPTLEKMSMLMRIFPRCTGLAVENSRMALCSKNQIWFFQTAAEITDANGDALPYEMVFVPRRAHVTGDIGAHQLTFSGEQLLVVNTRFSCLCTLDSTWSFVPEWKPRFISAYAPEDRCHLNGVCLERGTPRFASALGETDTPEGWRANRAGGGIVIDIPSNEVVVRGLAMPHTPILYQDRLWILESGTGSLLVVDPKNGACTVVARFPGFLRGLAFVDRFAFVGLCKAREKKHFGELPIERMHAELKCAIYVVDIVSGETIGFIEFTKGIEELFDIQILSGCRLPHVIGLQEEELLDGVMVLPPETPHAPVKHARPAPA